ncbi:dynein light chain Tctex-type 5-like [Glandiceps talaboti]
MNAMRKTSTSERKLSMTSTGTASSLSTTKRDFSDKSSADGKLVPMNSSATPLPGLGLRGLLAAKRLTRNLRLRSKAKQLRGSSWLSFSDRPRAKSTTVTRATMQPTYKLEPDKPFTYYEPQIEHMMTNLLESRLDGTRYDPKRSAILCRLLSDEIKDWIKSLNIDRYKIIVVVNIGETERQGISIASRAVWDTSSDTFVSCDYRNTSLFCVATVYGVYAE